MQDLNRSVTEDRDVNNRNDLSHEFDAKHPSLENHQNQRTSISGTNPSFVTFDDLSNFQKLDMIVTNSRSNDVSIFHN
ncbi:hypothetical protein I4U23_023018 [Adineta vaga]|nr:hypothetical protein I4U23_023018 [Adineta vaga]